MFFMKLRLLIIGLTLCTLASALQGGIIVSKSVGRDDVASAIAAASTGDTVVIPKGSAVWTSGVTVNRSLRIKGSGSGRIVGRSTSSLNLATGTQFLTTQAGLKLTPGQTIRVSRTGNRGRFMEGTVTSYSGTTLEMNVATTGGTGSDKLWLISTQSDTVIVNGYSGTPFSNFALFTVSEQPGQIDLSGIKLAAGTGNAPGIKINRSQGGEPVLIHDMWIETRNTSGNDAIWTNSNKGVVWNVSFDCSSFSQAPLAFHHTCLGETDSWTTPSTIGDEDTTGKSNFYIEDCDFHAWLNATDLDSNSRAVIRHCIFNNSGMGTHGADTGPYGVRHFELYDNVFIYNGYTDLTTLPLAWWVYVRGGTGVITDNVMPDINSQDYGNKSEINLTVMNLQRNANPNPCWGANVPGIQYPAPRQVGMGFVTGTGGTDSVTYRGDSEPLYIWNNSGSYSVGLSDYGSSDCSAPDRTSDYVIRGRDYFVDVPKPGYTKYQYPHPLRNSGDPASVPVGVEVIADP
ncbi:MAG: hypothetical protein R3F19_30800 [Verrucomicrobiales bacterium]